MKSKNFITILLVNLLILEMIRGQETTTPIPYKPDPVKLEAYLTGHKCNDTQQENVKIGDQVTLCIHFDGIDRRMAFNIPVDEYSVVSIGGGYALALELMKLTNPDNTPRTEVSFVAEVARNFTYFPSIYTKAGLAIPLFSLVIKVHEGKITDIVWDNTCLPCKEELCLKEKIPFLILNEDATKCVADYENCKMEKLCTDDTSSTIMECDPKFYITWFGTDANKRQMKSSNLAMSKFKQYSITSLYESARDILLLSIEEIKKKWIDVSPAIKKIIDGLRGN